MPCPPARAPLDPRLNTEAAHTDREAGNAFDTYVKWLEHHGYPDVNFVEKLASLRDYALSFK